MVRPVASRFAVTLGYRQKARFNPNYIHRGIDYGCPKGTEVHATQAGVVVSGGYGSAYGVQVVVRVGDVWCLYAHLSKALVRAGERVETGQAVGLSGATGNVTGAHLHYQENTQPPAAYKSDRAPRFIDASAPTQDALTVFDVSFWNVASPRWYTPWKPRVPGISDEIRGEASIQTFAEVYDEQQAADIQAALGAEYTRVSGRAGAELFYDSTRWSLERPAKSYASGIQGRYATVVHLRRIATGQHVAFVVTHGPVTFASLKAKFGTWLSRLLSQIDGPIVLAGDFNRNTKSPRTEVERLGYRTMRAQAAIANESADEFPSEGWNLSDIYTIPSKARITGGQIDLTAARLSDHRRLEARVVIP